MVHILEGVVERGTATILRDLDRPLFGKTGTTSGPTNVWFIGGTPDVVAGVYIGYDQPRPMGACRAGRPGCGADLQAIRPGRASRTCRKIPFVAPAGIRMVRIDRVTGKRVFGNFPTTIDPKSSVIWEAFQPETEPRRAFRRSVELASARRMNSGRRRDARPSAGRPPQQRAPADSAEFLQRQGGIY